jgi:uncharacterized protein YlxW (UPF0749 family)
VIVRSVYTLTICIRIHNVINGTPAAVGAGESNEKEAVLTRHVSELSASVKGLETDKERLMREVATMTVSIKSLQEELATTQDEGKEAGNAKMTMVMTKMMMMVTSVAMMLIMKTKPYDIGMLRDHNRLDNVDDEGDVI